VAKHNVYTNQLFSVSDPHAFLLFANISPMVSANTLRRRPAMPTHFHSSKPLVTVARLTRRGSTFAPTKYMCCVSVMMDEGPGALMRKKVRRCVGAAPRVCCAVVLQRCQKSNAHTRHAALVKKLWRLEMQRVPAQPDRWWRADETDA
jgi:hypothetical protein